jgi:hypothetical protein
VCGNVTRAAQERIVWQTREVRVRLIGYWRGESDDHLPDPRDFVDETWDDRERDLVARYLEEGFSPWAFAGYSQCRICGKANGCAELTDGVYLWPEGLAHYVREHSVKLPDDVLDHITHRQDELSALDVDRAWWPRVASLENREK